MYDFETHIYTPKNSLIYAATDQAKQMYHTRLHFMTPVVTRDYLNLIAINLFSDRQDVDLSIDQVCTLPHKYDDN